MSQVFDVNNFVIDRILRGVMQSTTNNEVLWAINQISNPSLSCTVESTDAVDALGTRIMTFERAKSATFSAENSLFDLGLAAAQFGTEKEVASSSKKIIAPAFETVDVTAEATYTLKHTPTEQITAIYALNGDSTLGTKYTNGASASATEFVHSQGQTTVTLPTGLAVGSQLFIIYEYESEAAVSVSNNAVNFPKAGKFVMEVLGCDVCDATKLVHAYIVFPNAKLSGEVDMTFTTEGTHPFTIECMQEYCDKVILCLAYQVIGGCSVLNAGNA